MKRSWILWNIVAFVLTLLAIYSFSNQAYSTFKYHEDSKYLDLVIEKEYLELKDINKGVYVVYPDISKPDLSIKRFIIETLMLNTMLMPIFFIAFIIHGLIILFFNFEELAKDNSDFSNFRLYHYFFIFSNPITYYVLILYYTIPKIYNLLNSINY